MMNIIGIALIIALIGVEIYCGICLYYYLQWRSNERAKQRRAATMPMIRKQVHKEYTIERNRKALWETMKEENI